MKKKLLTLLIGVSLVVALVTVPFMTACAPEVVSPEVPEAPEVPEVPEVPEEVPDEAPETAKIGVILPLTGFAAQWGLAWVSSMDMIVDEINEAGGLKVGDERYLVEIVYYDDEYTASKSIIGAKKLVLEDKVKVVIIMPGPPCTSTLPWLTEQKMLVVTGHALEVNPDRPYLISCGDNWPFQDAMELQYLAEAHPGLEKIAYTCQDDGLGLFSSVVFEAMAESLGWEVVYGELFSVETMDFAPIVTAMLEGDPDVVALGGIWGGFRKAIMEEFYLQGGEGIFYQASEWHPLIDFINIPDEFVEGSVAYNADVNDPTLPDVFCEFRERWYARYGPGAPEDLNREMTLVDAFGYGYINVWRLGVELAGTFDPVPVIDALLTQPTVPHLYGPSYWWGQEMCGLNYSLMCPQIISEMHNGVNSVVAIMDFMEWWEANKTPIVSKFIEYGLMYWQQ